MDSGLRHKQAVQEINSRIGMECCGSREQSVINIGTALGRCWLEIVVRREGCQYQIRLSISADSSPNFLSFSAGLAVFVLFLADHLSRLLRNQWGRVSVVFGATGLHEWFKVAFFSSI